MTNEKILVTAANGKVGRELVFELQRRGADVRAGVHHPEKAPDFGVGVEIVRFSFDDASTIQAALEGIDTLVLITPPAREQVDWATLTLDLAIAAGVRRVVRMSVLAAAMEPGIQLGRWHRVVERYLQGTDLSWTIVRPGPFSANFSSGMYPASDGHYAVPAGNAPVNHIDIRDVALALAETVTGSGHEGRIYMITGAEGLTFQQAIARLSSASGRSLRYTDLDPDVALAAFSTKVPEWLARILGELFAAFRTGAVGMYTPTFEQLTGQAPRPVEAFFTEKAKKAA